MKYKIGAMVRAKWSNGKFYQAKILKKLKDSTVVKFIDDDVVYNVKNHLGKFHLKFYYVIVTLYVQDMLHVYNVVYSRLYNNTRMNLLTAKLNFRPN